ncbi:hypothetical protein H5V45_01965 [Nocardioides sp. KIGAM211]|uniref:Uncharacterized protein n=1 Tax=Nocardioides luti TaxID=2761101 RepID=A0A7X0RD49_9ACTN|nr:hypothetical protein [Nocardioides luti]MBB6626076.1 hypothetical protein [Nocardioides luti]
MAIPLAPIVMASCAALCVGGVVLMVVSRNDLVGKPQKVRNFNLARYPRMPIQHTPLAPIPDRSTRWQVGLGLLIYPWIGFVISGLLWLDSRH